MSPKDRCNCVAIARQAWAVLLQTGSFVRVLSLSLFKVYKLFFQKITSISNFKRKF